jgi:hypothetical protein
VTEIEPTTHTLDVMPSHGVPLRVVLLTDGKSLSRPAANKYRKNDAPVVEFYDRRYPHTPDGQFICEYHLDTLLPDGNGGTFMLWADVPDWRVDGATMVRIREWLRTFA